MNAAFTYFRTRDRLRFTQKFTSSAEPAAFPTAVMKPCCSTLYTLALLHLLSVGSIATAEAPIMLPRAPRVIVLDGVAEATWEGSTKHPIAELLSGTISSPTDLAATWQGYWDDEALYLMLQAVDDSRVRNAMNKPGRSDAFDVGIDLQGGDGGALRGPLQHRFRFEVGDGPVEGTRWEGIAVRKRSIRVPRERKFSEDKWYDETGYAIEARIPWATLGGFTGHIGLQFVVADYDGGQSTAPEAVVAASRPGAGDAFDPRNHLVVQLAMGDGRAVPKRTLAREYEPTEGTVVFADDFGPASRGELVDNIVQLKPPLGMGYSSKHHRGYKPLKWIWSEPNGLSHPQKGFWVIAEKEDVLIQAGRSIPSAVFAGQAVPTGTTHYDIEFAEFRNDNDYIGYIVGASAPEFAHDGVEFGYETQIPLTDQTTPNLYYRGALGAGVLADRAYPRQWARHRIEIRGQRLRWLIEDRLVVERTVSALRPGGYFGITHRSERDTRYDDVRITVLPEERARNVEMRAVDFQRRSEGYYDDRLLNCLAVDADRFRNVYASASHPFPGVAGLYELQLEALGDSGGQSTFRIFVDSRPLGTWTIPSAPGGAGEGRKIVKVWKDVRLEAGEEVRVESNAHSTDGMEFSRGRWSKVVFVPTP